jgi:hypothetical protein
MRHLATQNKNLNQMVKSKNEIITEMQIERVKEDVNVLTCEISSETIIHGIPVTSEMKQPQANQRLETSQSECCTHSEDEILSVVSKDVTPKYPFSYKTKPQKTVSSLTNRMLFKCSPDKRSFKTQLKSSLNTPKMLLGYRT